MTDRNAFINQLSKWHSAKEGGIVHEMMVTTYNTIKPLPRNYEVTIKDPWCAIFISAAAQAVKLTDIIYPECSSTKMYQEYVKRNLNAPANARPEIGWIAFYGTNDTNMNHVGVVANVGPTGFTTIEGNWNDRVSIRAHSYSAPIVRAFGTPLFLDIDVELFLARNFMVNRGIFQGDENGNMMWDRPPTRDELALVFYRYHNMR